MEVLSALKLQDLDEGTNISLVLVDNGVSQTSRAEILETHAGSALMLKNRENLGFSAAVNQCLAEAIRFDAQYLLLLNPDLMLETVAIREMLRAVQRHPEAAMISPKLVSANQDLSPSSPTTLDACGMIMTTELRHLDRGSGQIDNDQFNKEEEVFGGTGACLLIKISQIQDLLLPRSKYESALWKVYPQLEQGANERPQLLDESFFAYREDADLAWRAQIRGKKIIYCPGAVGHHVRRVTPEVRSKLPADINLWSVRNRFLMQINNLKPFSLFRVFWPGLLKRNLLVVAAVILKERSSFGAFKHIFLLWKRSIEQRRFILDPSATRNYSAIEKWF